MPRLLGPGPAVELLWHNSRSLTMAGRKSQLVKQFEERKPALCQVLDRSLQH